MERFEAGNVYKRMRYGKRAGYVRVTRRTEKTVWVCYISEEGKEYSFSGKTEDRYRSRQFNGSELISLYDGTVYARDVVTDFEASCERSRIEREAKNKAEEKTRIKKLTDAKKEFRSWLSENGITIEVFRKVYEKSNDVLRDAMIEVLYGEQVALPPAQSEEP